MIHLMSAAVAANYVKGTYTKSALEDSLGHQRTSLSRNSVRIRSISDKEARTGHGTKASEEIPFGLCMSESTLNDDFVHLSIVSLFIIQKSQRAENMMLL